ncbi:hypothetical protein O6H91_16G004900 [Diphasiastrum complanatum]|uniref:Uncharacterized protein n=1 Tax=Diphasiastrum complanatum TaxID=34168 RepID=A0ACC2B9G8_DIPCM|nr:hypothetical protein O6H91_16G004900 [Diphasiastrum complanatum]
MASLPPPPPSLHSMPSHSQPLTSPSSSSPLLSGTTADAPITIGISTRPAPSTKRKRRLADLTSEEVSEIIALRGKMPQAVVGKKYGIEQTEVSAIQRSQRAKTARVGDDHEKKNAIKRIKDVEISLPIVYGTISFWLGKKADELHSHKWTVYVRSAADEDLGVVIKKVVFQLHPSFNNPTRVVEAAPFELNESGWGEFEIGITVFFHGDVGEKPLELFHHLKLYPADESGPQSTKKPVVVEAYDEIVFSEPPEAFLARVRNHPAVAVLSHTTSGTVSFPAAAVEGTNEKSKGDTKDHPLRQWFLKHSEAEELPSIAAARQQVQNQIMKLRRDLHMLETEALQLKSSAGH